jgi:hypothetical protein
MMDFGVGRGGHSVLLQEIWLLDGIQGKRLCGWEVDRTGSESCKMTSFGFDSC